MLLKGACINPSTDRVSLANCDTYNQDGQCTQCLYRHYLKDGVCTPVSILCGSYDRTTGGCTSCNSEYFNLQGGECVQLLRIVEGCSGYQGPYCA